MPSLYKSEILSAIVVLAFIALIFWIGYAYGKASNAFDVGETNGKVAQQNLEAKQKLNELTAERDQKQKAIDNAYHEQEQKDAHAKTEINRLTNELGKRPMLVRVECPSGKSGSSATNKSSSTANNNSGNASPTYGLLPKANSERLARAVKEVEQLSAAYNSCRSTLSVNQHMP